MFMFYFHFDVICQLNKIKKINKIIGRLPVAMATVSKIRLHVFVCTILIHPLTKNGKHDRFRFVVTFVTVFSLVFGLVSLPWQPDQNNTCF